jgi:hypothetical protein
MTNTRLLILDGLAEGRLTITETESLLGATADRPELKRPNGQGKSLNDAAAFPLPSLPTFLEGWSPEKWI